MNLIAYSSPFTPDSIIQDTTQLYGVPLWRMWRLVRDAQNLRVCDSTQAAFRTTLMDAEVVMAGQKQVITLSEKNNAVKDAQIFEMTLNANDQAKISSITIGNLRQEIRGLRKGRWLFLTLGFIAGVVVIR